MPQIQQYQSQPPGGAPSAISGSFPSPTKISNNGSKKGMIDVEEEYQFKKSMIEDLISEEKVLLALQQE